MTELKKCNSCLTDKPLSEFYFRKDSNCYKNRCKKCCIDMRPMHRDSEKKVCKHCGEAKFFSDFQSAGGGKWLQPYCKECDKVRKKKWEQENIKVIAEKRKIYYKNNKETISVRQKKYNEKNSEAVKRRQRDYYEKNSEALKERSRKYSVDNRMYISERNKKFRRDNKETVKTREANKRADPEFKKKKSLQDRRYREQNPDKIKRMKADYYIKGGLQKKKEWQRSQSNNFEFVTKRRLRGRIYVALKRGVKSKPTMELLGCTIDQFKRHFESLFTVGMNWERYMAGEIVIDHIIPCVKFNLIDPEEQKKCFHYTNLQPLWELDNLKKATKIL